MFLVGSDRLGQVDGHAPADQGARADRGHDPRRRARPRTRSRASACRTTAATSAWSSRTSSCCRTAPCTTTSPTRCRSPAAARREIRDKVPDILRLTGLSTKLHNYPDQLSGGEQQRVSIARAFVNHPPLLLADEPTGNLDPETSIGIMQLLYRINRTGTTVLVATHDHAMVDKMRRRVIELTEGRIVRDEAAGLYTARRDHARVRRPHARRRAPIPTLDPTAAPAASTRRTDAMKLGFFLREAMRSMRRNAAAELRRAGHRARDDARARRVHPDRPGDERRRQQVRGRVLVDVYLKTDATAGRRRARARELLDDDAARQDGRSSSPRRRPTRRSASATRRPTSCSAPTRCPTPSASLPDNPGNVDRAPQRARRRRRAGGAPRRSTRRSTRSSNRRDETEQDPRRPRAW